LDWSSIILTELVLSDLFEHIELDLPIDNGGPVAPKQLFYLHRFANIKGATRVTDQLYFGATWQEVLTNADRFKKSSQSPAFVRRFCTVGAQGSCLPNSKTTPGFAPLFFRMKHILKRRPLVFTEKLHVSCKNQHSPCLRIFHSTPQTINLVSNLFSR